MGLCETLLILAIIQVKMPRRLCSSPLFGRSFEDRLHKLRSFKLNSKTPRTPESKRCCSIYIPLGEGTQAFFQISELQAHFSSITLELEEIKQKHADGEKEQEDILVFLDELQAKRRRDKEKLRTTGQEVSDDEDADDGEETDAE